MQKILKEEKLYVTDTSMRDAQQSLVATRMRSKDLCGAAIITVLTPFPVESCVCKCNGT